MSISVRPYSLNVPQDVLDDLRARLERTRLPGSVAGTGWSRGVDFDYMKDLIDYWLHEYDWCEQEAKLNQYEHFEAEVDGLGIHFIREEGNGTKSYSVVHDARVSVVVHFVVANPPDADRSCFVRRRSGRRIHRRNSFHYRFWILGLSQRERFRVPAPPGDIR